MANWAIVVGVNRYTDQRAFLKGGVRDALKMRDWLLSPTGGNVPLTNLLFAAAPDPPSEIPAGVVVRDATYDSVVATIDAAVRQSGGVGENLFFYFAGHGLSIRKDFKDDDALLTSDFTTQFTTHSLLLSSITDYFQAYQFQDQFFFIDACRNAPFKGDFRIGEIPWAPSRDPSQPAVQQFIFLATSSGLPATELQRADDESGAFTDALRRGLAGAGRAKAWNPARLKYTVRVDRLFEFVIKEVQTLLGQRSQDDRQFFEVPRLGGERGAAGRSPDPVLAEIDPSTVSDAVLTVTVVQPKPSPDTTTVYVEREKQLIDKQSVTASVFSIPLPPKEYMIRADAPGFVSVEPYWEVDLYDPQSLDIALIPRTSAPPGTPPNVPGPTWNVGLGKLTVRTADRFGMLEITDTAGDLKTSAQGKLTALLPGGSYRVRLISPDGRAVEQSVPDLSEGEPRELEIQCPRMPEQQLFQSLANEGIISSAPNNTIRISETIGPIGWADSSTLLSVAGVARVLNWPSDLVGQLGGLGFRSFEERFPKSIAGAGVLVGADFRTSGEAAEYLSAIRVSIESQQGKERTGIENCSGWQQIAQFLAATEPGSYWVRLELPDAERDTSFALTVLPGRVSLLVLRRHLDGAMNALHYFSDKGAGTSPLKLRQAEVLQRTFRSGRLDRAIKFAGEFEFNKTDDPIVGCLGAYAFIRSGRAEELERSAYGLSDSFPDLADSHVIRAAWLRAKRNDEEAASAFGEAADRGLPINAYGLALLHEAIFTRTKSPIFQRLRLHLVETMELAFHNRVRGPIWTAIETAR